MQADLDTVVTPDSIQIQGVNEVGQEAGNPVICAGRTIPWLQDTPSVNAWGKWQVTWRDVVVLDPQNKVLFVYNLTDHDLADSTNYAELRSRLLQAAGIQAPVPRTTRSRSRAAPAAAHAAESCPQ
jgi:hypothetical protein